MPRARRDGERDLLEYLGGYLDSQAVDNIRDACRFGAEAHHGQTRASGEAYIHHPLAVARILGEMRMDSRTIIAAVLHDVVEDTDITLAQLAERFGDDVAKLVDGVSKVSQLEQQPKEHAEAASFRKMFMATATDIRVIIIKLSDRLHNMRTLGSLKEEKKRRVARQTLEIYAPIANRLGMRDLAQKLEDLSLRTLYPKRYNAISKRLNSNKRGRKSVLDEACASIHGELERAGIAAEVHGREKDIYSIYRKMQQKKLLLKDVQDINAIRVVADSRAQCYNALGVIHRLYKPRAESFKDYIAIPKVNGYQSLHTVVIGPFGQSVEVQIRSRAMHRVAEKGVASHWLYKTDTTGEHAPQQLAQAWLSSFLESQQSTLDLGEFLEHLKADLFPDQVYVFTPKGDIKRLPRGATALDFAYAVHTDVGNRCIGARINQQMVPLHGALANGDRVEIITSRSARPQLTWLGYAATPKTRASIRHFVNQQESKDAFRVGRKLLKQSLAQQGYRRLRIPSAHKVALLQHLALDDWTQLLSDIGFGKRYPMLVAKQLIAETSDHAPSDADHGATMTIEGTERLLVTHANCCHPIPGDPIIGTLTSGRGLVVHRANCPNSREFARRPDNYFHLAWSPATRGKFQVIVKMETRNQPGVLARVSNIIAEHEANINNLQVEPQHHDTSSMSFTIEVTGRTHLAAIMRQLHAERSVIRLARG
ncbi:MAG: RelA/SpoT family protein [bacterium]